MPPKEISFEQALAGVEQVVHDLEDGQFGLAESLARYEEGVRLLKQCYETLENAERKIEILTGVEPTGEIRTEPFADNDLAPEESPPSNSSRHRSATPRRASE